MRMRGTLFLIITMSITFILAGCFQGEQSLEETDPPPENAEGVDNLDDTTSDDEGLEEDDGTEAVEEDVDEQDVESETVERQLFLIDADGMVAPQTLDIPTSESKEVATQALEYLVKGGPVTSMLPNGFQAVLPEGTEILGLDMEEEGTMIVDVSTEFENYEAEDELKILQAMTHTLTQFENVNKVKLWINGYPQDTMPVDGTPIENGYTRANGINLMESDTIDLLDSKAVTLYYPTEHNENQYFVPVTQHVEVESDLYSSMVQALLDGPGYSANVTHVFNTGASLVNDPLLNNGILELVFSEEILKDMDKATISDEVMETLVLSLTEDQEVEAVQVKVENVEELYNEDGEAYEEPVTKDTFMPTEKL